MSYSFATNLCNIFVDHGNNLMFQNRLPEVLRACFGFWKVVFPCGFFLLTVAYGELAWSFWFTAEFGKLVWSCLLTVPPRPEIRFGLFCSRFPHRKLKRGTISKSASIASKKDASFRIWKGVLPSICQEAAQYLPKRLFKQNAPFILLILMGPFSRTLFSPTLLPWPNWSLLFRANSTCKVLEHLVWSNTSGFPFWGPLARTNLICLLALCGLPNLGILWIWSLIRVHRKVYITIK